MDKDSFFKEEFRKKTNPINDRDLEITHSHYLEEIVALFIGLLIQGKCVGHYELQSLIGNNDGAMHIPIDLDLVIDAIKNIDFDRSKIKDCCEGYK